ncbi:FAD-dependent oxidoreductase [Antribacter sp. KLBMP9083]|uniref:FAD-dependent oxidoreductase n=1 Tax=Antribacter soli TaxID=2910976 RepID=A0AA41QHD4_9MICO|nr:FAD-dependent oxidoreductase [Antribacter soli]MCF4123158.1 FAD-dependent oxidoreductase [Antribacter soli]
MDPYVLVGGGLAVARAAEALRDEGYDGDLVVVTTEPHRPYERPPLSKGYLRGEDDRDVLFPLDEAWYGEHGVELRTSVTAVGLVPRDHKLTLSDGTTLRWSKILLATGSTPRALDVPGTDLAGVHYLRTVDDSDRLSGRLLDASLEGAGRLVVVGDGWIGLEVAASARQLGLDVTLIGRGTQPLSRALGPEMGALYGSVHEEHGVRVLRRAHVVGLSATDGWVTGVDLADGSVVGADVVVVGVGASPNVGLAEAAGLALRPPAEGGGIAVSGTLTTSHPDVFAAGDVASVPSPHYGRPLRVEHWSAAQEGGAHAGRAMAGSGAEYDKIPYFYSDQYDVGMEYLGWVDVPGGYDDVVIAGSVEERELVAFWVASGRVVAGMSINVWEQMGRVEELIGSQTSVPKEELQAFLR